MHVFRMMPGHLKMSRHLMMSGHLQTLDPAVLRHAAADHQPTFPPTKATAQPQELAKRQPRKGLQAQPAQAELAERGSQAREAQQALQAERVGLQAPRPQPVRVVLQALRAQAKLQAQSDPP